MAIGKKTNIGRCVKPNRSHKLLPKHLWNLHPDVTREVISGRRGNVNTGAEWEVTPSGLVLGPTLNTFFYTDTDGYPQPQNPEGWTLWTYGWHVVPPSSSNANPCIMTLDGTTGGSGGEANRVMFEGDFRQWRGAHFDQFTDYGAIDSQAHDGIPVVLLAVRLRPPNDKVELVIIDSKLNTSVYESLVTYAGSFTDDPGNFDFTAGRGAQICGWDERGLSNGELMELATNPHALFEGPKQFALTDMPADVRLLTAPKLKPWTKQPPAGTPIDKSHPMAKHLKFFTCFNDSGLEAIDLVTGARGVDQSTGASTAVKAVNNFGKHLDVEAGSITTESTGLAWPIQPEYDLGGGKALTMLAHSHWEDESDSNGTRMFSTQSGSTGYEMVYRPGSSQIRVHVDGTSAIISAASGTQNDDAHFAGTYDGSNVKAWFKTDLTFLTATAAKTDSMATVVQANLHVGGREGLNRGFDGKVYWVALFDRVFNENEIRDFWANPWQIFEPQPIHATYPYVPAELGGPDGRDRLYTFKRFQ